MKRDFDLNSSQLVNKSFADAILMGCLDRSRWHGECPTERCADKRAPLIDFFRWSLYQKLFKCRNKNSNESVYFLSSFLIEGRNLTLRHFSEKNWVGA